MPLSVSLIIIKHIKRQIQHYLQAGTTAQASLAGEEEEKEVGGGNNFQMKKLGQVNATS